ncbi:MAG: DNA topoisomerase (ATP-hydrolyzing) subunit B [Candidatus Bathyarchaeia archaeon]
MSQHYSADQIQVLGDLEAVRKRPAMYIGSTDARGLQHLVFEVVDNSIDEALAGFCKNISVALNNDGSVTVRDDGRGIPVEMHVQTGKSALEVVMTMLHAGGKFDHKTYQVSGGLHGIGVSAVNALSEWLEAEVHVQGRAFKQRYERGVPTTGVQELGSVDDHGTRVSFKPDSTIFEETKFDQRIILTRLRELAFLTENISITFTDQRVTPPKTRTFNYEGGIREFVKYLNESKNSLHQEIVLISGNKADVRVDCAFQYTDDDSWSIHTFANNIGTREGGTHLVGLKTALTRAINDYATGHEMINEKLKIQGDDVREGLTAVLSVRLPNPQFEGQTKARLGNSEVRGIVESVLYDSLKTYFSEAPSVAKAIVQRTTETARARIAAKEAKELVRKKGSLEGMTLPGKLADCQIHDLEKTELFIVEGDSAGGSAKQARDRRTQAILPLRGKILNVEKHGFSRILDNNEIRALVTAIGTGIGEVFDVNNLRYGKIILLTDADVDGAHIRTLLLTFLYRHMPHLIEAGKVFIAQPPLYRIRKGDKIFNAMSEKERKRIIEQELKGKPDLVQRFKGLGEMNPRELWDTTMNPNSRSLLSVTVEDVAEADKVFSTLMGDVVEPRRQFIQENADEVDWLDI